MKFQLTIYLVEIFKCNCNVNLKGSLLFSRDEISTRVENLHIISPLYSLNKKTEQKQINRTQQYSISMVEKDHSLLMKGADYTEILHSGMKFQLGSPSWNFYDYMGSFIPG